MAEDVVCREVAEQEFERFCEEMELDVDESNMDEDDCKALSAKREKLVRAIQRGKLIVNEQGEPVYHYAKPNGEEVDLVFREPNLRVLTAQDRGKRDQTVGKMVQIMAAQTEAIPELFFKMKRRDYDVCVAVTSLFLG